MSTSIPTFNIRLLLALVAILYLVSFVKGSSPEILWLDFDMTNIPEPKERKSGYYDYFFKGQLIGEPKKSLDVPRWVRKAAGDPKQARNVNEVDEVPDSSWYWNRHYLRHMTVDELQRGPNKGRPPDFSSGVITKAKTAGVTPGMMVTDATGQAYLVKFDNATYPNLQSGAEVISTKILYASGYNVPENYIAYLNPKELRIADHVKIDDPRTGSERDITEEDIDEMLGRVARLPDGRCRVLASKILAGKPKGPFPQVGFRTDDPNDLIPHEHRRELRGLRVIASWINDWDLKEVQSMDMYVEEQGRKFLRHYLLDFGSSLGADDQPRDFYHGREYGLDFGNVGKEIITLGAFESPNEKHARIISSEIGNFTADDFNPGKWKPTYPSVMFANLTNEDAFWATRVILSFSEADLKSIIETGEYSDPDTDRYMLQTLLLRRQKAAAYWLGRVDALSYFEIRPEGNGVAMTFRDLMLEQKLQFQGPTWYSYQVNGSGYKSAEKRTDRTELEIDRETLAAAVEHGTGSPVELSIRTHRQGFVSRPVRVYFDWSSDRDRFTVRRISRE